MSMSTDSGDIRQAILEEFRKSPERAMTGAHSLVMTAAETRALRPGARIILTPPVLSKAEEHLMFTACRDVLKILLTLHERIFEGDLRRMGRWCGYPEEMLDRLLVDASPTGMDVLARSDMYETADGWKLLEMNVGSTVGGMSFSTLTRLMAEQDFYAGAFSRLGIVRVDSLRLWSEFVRALVLSKGKRRSARVALVESNESLREMAHTLGMMAAALSEQAGIEAFVCPPEELSHDGQGLSHGGEKVDVIYRLFDISDLLAHAGDYAQIFRSVAKREVEMPMGLHYKIFGNKCALALLSDPAFAHHYSPEELSTITRHVPWTRVLESEMLGEARARRAELVVKAAEGYGGLEVVCGCDTTDEDWRTLLSSLLSSDEKSVLQERLVPTTGELCLLAEGESPRFQTCQFLWGAYVFGGEFAGAILRAKALSEDKIINYQSGAFICPVLFQADHA
jgi:hypothetical protein